MRTHYLPRKYLSRFSIDSVSDIVWQYDRKERTFKDLPVSAVGVIKDWFTPETERQLSSVEGAVITAMDKLADSHEGLDEQEREAICRYIAAMIQRVPSGRKMALEIAPTAYNSITKDPQWLSEMKAKALGSDQVLAQFELDGTRERLMNDTSKLIHDFPKFQAVLNDMRWTVLLAEGNQRFITSDAPVFWDREAGIGRPDADLTIPLSSKAVLYLRREHLGQTIDFKKADGRVPIQLNRRAVYYSKRFTFSSRNDKWVKKVTEHRIEPAMRLAVWLN